MSMYVLLTWQNTKGPCMFPIILKVMLEGQKDPWPGEGPFPEPTQKLTGVM